MVLHQNNNNKNNKGFTLIETLVATIILGVALVPIVSLFIANLHNYQRAGEKSQLVAAATGIMEEIIASEKCYSAYWNNKTYTDLLQAPGNRSLHGNVTVVAHNNSPTLRMITVATYWDTAPDRTVSVTTIRRLN